MKMGHSFMPQHGFTGSANPSAEMRPQMPGYKRGGMPKVEHGEHGHHDKHEKNESHHHEDEHGFQIHKMKHGGKVHKKHKE